ncbi:MAG: methyltransferase domain-containing protein [Bacteroidales bacterium]|nr:methyltransferase domain-containing protein [Bacteroidales bacterium]
MYVNAKGCIDLPNDFADLITCFSTLHHIPNVTYVLNELFRVLKPGGFLLLREPIHSMGDWTKKRPGLTKHERGIPTAYLENIIRKAGITIVQKHYFGFMGSFLDRLFKGASFLHSRAFLRIDRCLSGVFSFNTHYHATNKMQRVSPTGVFYVLRK